MNEPQRPEITNGPYVTESCLRSEISATEKALNKRGYTVIESRQSGATFYITGVQNKQHGADFQRDATHTRL